MNDQRTTLSLKRRNMPHSQGLSMSRRRAAVLTLSLALASNSVLAYVPSRPSSTRTTTQWKSPIPRVQPLHTTRKTVSVDPQTQRLSKDDEDDLLRQAFELRRLKALESDLALQSPSLRAPMLSVRAKASGYGTDLEAYEEAIDDGHKAREALVTHNMGLVHYCVNDIVGKKSFRSLNSLSKEDLVQEGAIGLARAVDKYNPALGAKFSTYAVYWIRAAVLRCIAERDDLLRVPEHMSSAVRKMTAAAQRLGLELDGDTILSTFQSDARWKEAQAAKVLAEEAGLTDKQLTQALMVKNRRKMGGYVSFESWMQKGKDMEADIVTSQSDVSSGLDIDRLISTLSRFLRPKEMEALSWRYGLMNSETRKPYRDYLAEAEEQIFGSVSEEPVKGRWGEAMSFTEVGKHMSISAEYGRRLCHAALDKLKRAAEEGQLEPALLF